jgi:hypothetical protein
VLRGSWLAMDHRQGGDECGRVNQGASHRRGA